MTARKASRRPTQPAKARPAPSPVPHPQPPLPHYLPMLAVLSPGLPRDTSAFAYELKWDGVRALAYLNRHHAHLVSRNDLPILPRYPELSPLWKTLSKHQAVLDGEIIALDAGNRPSFPLLQRRMHVGDAASIQRLVSQVPIVYMIFDLLFLDGAELIAKSYEERRTILEKLISAGDCWRISPRSDDGEALLAAARAQELEGVIAKRRLSPYQSGQRSPDWLKIKLVASQEFVIGGWIPELGNNEARVGSLLLGYYDRHKSLCYAGRVGTGFNDAWHRRLSKQLAQLKAPASTFAERTDRGAIFVRPQLVAEVEYRRWPPGAKVQQAAFKGLREDKEPQEVRDERTEKSVLK